MEDRTASPFDAIRRVDEQGHEYWNAKDLGKLRRSRESMSTRLGWASKSIDSGDTMRRRDEERTVTMHLKTQAATEIAQFLAYHPTPEQIVAFHPSPEVAERAYELIHTKREGSLTEDERQELESYLVIEYLMELIKLEAHRQLRRQAS